MVQFSEQFTASYVEPINPFAIVIFGNATNRLTMKAKRIEIAIVYAAGIAQGLCMVCIPAVSTVLTSPKYYNLSNSEYGNLFIPMALLVISGSMLGPRIAQKYGLKKVFVSGLFFNLAAMGLLTLSQHFVSDHDQVYVILLFALGAMGAGFGSLLTALNVYVVHFFPDKPEISVTALHACLGTGTALAPLLASFFINVAVWWYLPLLIGILLVGLLILSIGQPLLTAEERDSNRVADKTNVVNRFPLRFWFYIVAICLYGICETLFGNWATIYLNIDKGISISQASIALATFWTILTVGRIFVAIISIKTPARYIVAVLPALIAIALVVISIVDSSSSSILAFGLAGLACSAYFPLLVGMAVCEYMSRATVVSGAMVASYITGYGIAAFTVGPVQNMADISLSDVYKYASALGILMLVLTIAISL